MTSHGIVFYAFGFNQYNIDKKFTSIHAEHDAVNKLRYCYKKKKKVDVLIFRVSKNGEDVMLGAPCENCRRHLKNGIKAKGYKLNKVYYTTNYGDICFIKSSFL